MADYTPFDPRVLNTYVGSSTDTKPTAPDVGSMAFETDTGTFYIFDGTTWQVYPLALTGTVNIGAVSLTGPLGRAADTASIPTTLSNEDVAALTAGQPTIWKNVAAQAITASTPFDLWTPASGKVIHLLGYALSLSVAGSVIIDKLHSAAYTELLRTPTVLAGSNTRDSWAAGMAIGVANDKLSLDVSSSGSVSGYVFGYEA